MAKTLLAQYFGNGSTQSFDLPRALTSGYALVVEIGGEQVTFDYTDADTVQLNAIPASGTIVNLFESNKLADLNQGLSGGKVVAYPKTTTSAVHTLLSAVDVDRVVLMSVEVTEVFANGDGAQPTFKIGQTSTDTKFSATSMLTSAAVTAKFALGGILSAGKELIVTATVGTGTTETGAIEVTVVAVPVIPA